MYKFKFKSIILNFKIILNLRFLRVFLFPQKDNELMSYLTQIKYSVIQKDKELLTIRDLGGSTLSRGKSFFTKEKLTIKWIESFKKNSKFLDVGANIGIYSLYAAILGHEVKSVEPEALNFAVLNMHIFDNSLNNKIEAFNFALNDKEGISSMALSQIGFGKSSHHFNNSKNEYVHKHGVYGTTTDKFLEEINFEPNYIKIDVDGNESLIIKGMKKTLSSKNLSSILVEIDKSGNNKLNMNKIFAEYNFFPSAEELVSDSDINIIYSKNT